MLISASESALQHLENADVMYIDGTFKTCPVPWYHLVFLQVSYPVFCYVSIIWQNANLCSNNCPTLFRCVCGLGSAIGMIYQRKPNLVST